jgi:4,4'-diaponeurosporenoate glycosyltransferase
MAIRLQAFMTPLKLFVLLCFWLLGFIFLWRIPNPRKCDQPNSAPAEVSIIIPARNEEKTLAILIDSLKHQTLKPLEIIVVDDHSEDSTAAIAAAADCVVLRSQNLPEGWVGKPWACWQGANKATGDILLFLDADTFLEPDGLSRILYEYREKKGLVSIQPFHRMEEAYERLSAFFNIVTIGGMNAFTLAGDKLRPLGAFGPCMVCSREDYFAVSGHSHARVRGAILESLALGKEFLRAKVKVHCYGGKGSLSFRMYPAGLSSLIEGFSKGFGSGANAMPIGSLLMMVCWIFGCFSVTRHLIQAAILGNITDLFASAFLDGLLVLQIHWMLMRIGNFGFLSALLFQIPLVFFLYVFTLSLVRIFFKRKVPWKGRIVSTPKERF